MQNATIQKKSTWNSNVLAVLSLAFIFALYFLSNGTPKAILNNPETANFQDNVY